MLAVALRTTQTGAVNAPAFLWAFRILWLFLPFTVLVGLTDATRDSSTSLRATIVIAFWVLWAMGGTSSLIPLPVTLTALRFIAPLAPTAAVVGVLNDRTPLTVGGIVVAGLAATLVMSAAVGDWFIDGASYGEERRFVLKAPVALLIGPIQLTWAVATLPLLSGILLLGSAQWLSGTLITVAGLVFAWWGLLAAWRLTQRWAVLVPAGLTLVDDMALAEPVLFASKKIQHLGPAHVDTSALDLSMGAPGLVLEAELHPPTEITPASRGKDTITEALPAEAILFVPSRPGALLEHAESRGLNVTRF